MFYIFIPTKMQTIKINGWKVKYWILDITEEPMLKRVSANGWCILVPSLMERRKNWIDCVDEENWLFEVYVNWELMDIVRWYDRAKRVLWEYEQRQYDMEEACWDYDLDFNE